MCVCVCFALFAAARFVLSFTISVCACLLFYCQLCVFVRCSFVCLICDCHAHTYAHTHTHPPHCHAFPRPKTTNPNQTQIKFKNQSQTNTQLQSNLNQSLPWWSSESPVALDQQRRPIQWRSWRWCQQRSLLRHRTSFERQSKQAQSQQQSQLGLHTGRQRR